MSIGQSMLSEFDMEMASTRKVLERVPEGKFDWKPHTKSGTMIWLAGHVANLPSWVNITFDQDTLDIEPGGVRPAPPTAPKTNAELVAMFDKNQAAARKALAEVKDDLLMKPWSLLKNGQTLLTVPRIGVLRGFIMNHMIHHRAQLCVYLRLNDVPVPGMYGPSADETAF
ncbi:MAG: DinB family protein [Acidobacteria bacterium]|nr:DinB family protein [Acidobacteriota bacterium]